MHSGSGSGNGLGAEEELTLRDAVNAAHSILSELGQVLLGCRPLLTRDARRVLAAQVREAIDTELEKIFGDPVHELGAAEFAVLAAAQRLEPTAGAEFWSRRIELAEEAGVPLNTLDLALFRLKRDKWLRHESFTGRGTLLQVLRRVRP